jgi:hypothetical protein
VSAVDLTGAQWFKSSRSRETSACVETAFLPAGHVGVRDSKDKTGPALVFEPSEWDAFTSNLAGGKFDLA